MTQGTAQETTQETAPKTMQALVMTGFGRLELQTLPMPQMVRPDDVLLEIQAAGVCGSDLHGYTGATGRRTPPLVMGHEATGQVVAVGAGVTGLELGARVALMPLLIENGCRHLLGMDVPGAYATHVVWPAGRLFGLPDNVSDDAGAFAEPLAVALHALGVSRTLTPTYDSAFVAGAGTIGLLIASVLLASGVRTVVVSDVSEARLEVARQLGVMRTVNPAQEDGLAVVRDLTGEAGAEVSFEAVGISETVAQSVAFVRDGGTAIWVGNNRCVVEVDMQAVVTRELRVLGSYGLNDEDFGEALEWLAAGRIDTQTLTSRRAPLRGSEGLFDELLGSPETIKCLIDPSL